MIKRIIAVGSPHGDDQVAWALVKKLDVTKAKEQGVDILFRDRPGLSLLKDFDPAEPTLLIDAADFGGRIGECRLLDHQAVQDRSIDSHVSGHGIGVQGLLDLAHSLKHPLPALNIMAIQIQSVEPMTPLSEELTSCLPDLFVQLKRFLRVV